MKDLRQKLADLNEGTSAQIDKLKAQVGKLDTVLDDVEKTQDRIRDKVEKQIPNDVCVLTFAI